MFSVIFVFLLFPFKGVGSYIGLVSCRRRVGRRPTKRSSSAWVGPYSNTCPYPSTMSSTTSVTRTPPKKH